MRKSTQQYQISVKVLYTFEEMLLQYFSQIQNNVTL